MPRIELKLHQISEGLSRLEYEETPIVLIRTDNGIVAYLDRCPHAQWPLSEGEINNGTLHCPGHGWEFDVRTGRCLNAPAYRLKVFSVSAIGSDVFIDWDGADLKSETVSGD